MSECVNKKMQDIFDKVQSDSSCHKKYEKVLTAIYKSTPLEEFLEVFMHFLQLIFCKTTDNNIYVKRSLSFCSGFCVEITRLEDKNEENHTLLPEVINKILIWNNSTNYALRYNSSRFITMILEDIGEEVQLEVDLIDKIQKSLLERATEMKVSMRSQAIIALHRLQDPHNLECPVMEFYLRELATGCANIRKEAVTRIAPNNITVNKIKDRIRDVEPGVRSAAYHRCADFGPLVYKIADRHMILLCGFKETVQSVKNTFADYLLPKWLTAYKGDFLKFLGALKLTTDEEDLVKIEYLSEELIKYFYNNHPINDLIAALPINEEKLIKIEDLTNEVSLFWKILVNLMRESNDMEDYLTKIIPELTQFANYVERFVESKSRTKMGIWEFFDYQFDLFNLLEIAEKYDYSDEVGRCTMQKLTYSILSKFTFTTKVTKKIVSISHKCSSSIDIFTNDMCQLISEIREPLTEQPHTTDDEQIQKKYKIATIKFKISLLEDQQEEALRKRDYNQAHLLTTELESLKKELEDMQNPTEKIRTVKSDNETLCRCLDVLIGVLELAEVNKLTPALLTCKENFLIPLITHQGAETHWRVLKCLTLFALIDKATAEEYGKIICIPMATYRTIPNNNVNALIQSTGAVIDLISVYGIEIVGGQNIDDNSSTSTTNQSVTKRKLYNKEETISNHVKHDVITFSDIFEILLEMLDDENEEIRCKAVFAIGTLIKQAFPVTASVVSRLILKWFNPLIEKEDSRLRVGLGLLIETFMQRKDFCGIMKDAIIPTLSSVVNAPKTSPLADINRDNLLMFFAQTQNVGLKKDDVKILALDTCMKMSENLKDGVVILLAKFLNHLDIHMDNVESSVELIDRVEMLSESITDKTANKFIIKFLAKLRQQKAAITVNTTKQTDTSNNESTVLREVANQSKEPQQIKRKKQRAGKDCVVVLERFDRKKMNETTLHTIIEETKDTDEDLRIETPTTSESSKGSKRDLKIVISETSDSEHDGSSVSRRSNRLRKKRIV